MQSGRSAFRKSRSLKIESQFSTVISIEAFRFTAFSSINSRTPPCTGLHTSILKIVSATVHSGDREVRTMNTSCLFNTRHDIWLILRIFCVPEISSFFLVRYVLMEHLLFSLGIIAGSSNLLIANLLSSPSYKLYPTSIAAYAQTVIQDRYMKVNRGYLANRMVCVACPFISYVRCRPPWQSGLICE